MRGSYGVSDEWRAVSGEIAHISLLTSHCSQLIASQRFRFRPLPENATIELPHMSTATVGITPEILRDHGLTADEYERIKQLVGREPSFTELGIFSVMWSEHCSYKSSRVHL